MNAADIIGFHMVGVYLANVPNAARHIGVNPYSILRNHTLARLVGHEREIRMPSGVVYLIKSGEHYKIGSTTNLSKRLSVMQTGNPIRMTVVHTWTSDYMEKLETFLQRECKEFRGIGEWFSIDTDKIQLLMEMNDKSLSSEIQNIYRHCMIEVEVWECTCDICGHVWRTESRREPSRCANPNCRSTVWNRPAIKSGRPRDMAKRQRPPEP